MSTPAKPPAKKAAKPPAKKAAAAPPTPPADPPKDETTPPAPPYDETPPEAPKLIEEKTEKPVSESGFAASRRADYARALREERDMCKAQGKGDRVKAIDAELKRVEGRRGGTDQVEA